jgi:DnaJ-class molecular chaperone
MNQRVETCPVCKGWGSKQLPLTTEYIPCDYCHGKAVQLITNDFYLDWDIPPFIEYRTRKINQIKKRTSFIVTLILILIALLTIITMILLIQ